MVTVPYVPALGPVGPGTLSEELFNAVADIADTGQFLPYDKDQRWSNTKDERLIVDEIIHELGRTVIPTVSTRGRGLVKVHYYGDNEPRLSEITEWLHTWCATFGVAAGRILAPGPRASDRAASAPSRRSGRSGSPRAVVRP